MQVLPNLIVVDRQSEVSRHVCLVEILQELLEKREVVAHSIENIHVVLLAVVVFLVALVVVDLSDCSPLRRHLHKLVGIFHFFLPWSFDWLLDLDFRFALVGTVEALVLLVPLFDNLGVFKPELHLTGDMILN